MCCQSAGAVRVNGTDEFIGTVEQLPKPPFALTGVHLRNNAKVTDDGLSFFQGCRNVRHLDLAVTKVTDAGLANFKDCRDLTVLDLFSTNVGDAGVAHFRECKLTDLSLRSTRVTDAVGAYIGHGTEFNFLGLAHTQLTAAGLAHFRNCTKLKHLDLDALPVDDAAVAPFADCINIEVLHLAGTRVTNPGIARFKECKRLRFVLLRGTPVTAAGIDDLKAALPLCRIEWDGGVVAPAVAPFTDADAKRVAALSPAEQVVEVGKELKRRNPGFDGALTPVLENDAVTGLTLSAAGGHGPLAGARLHRAHDTRLSRPGPDEGGAHRPDAAEGDEADDPAGGLDAGARPPSGCGTAADRALRECDRRVRSVAAQGVTPAGTPLRQHGRLRARSPERDAAQGDELLVHPGGAPGRAPGHAPDQPLV
jgi:hypothetical protein